MANEEVESLDSVDRIAGTKLRKEGWWAAKAFLPAVKMPGPPLPPFGDPGCTYMFEKMQAR